MKVGRHTTDQTKNKEQKTQCSDPNEILQKTIYLRYQISKKEKKRKRKQVSNDVTAPQHRVQRYS